MKMEIKEEYKDAPITKINNHRGNINLEGTSTSHFPLPQDRLYKVMEAKSNVQDRCFVEKVQLHKQHILDLCTALLSATEEDGNAEPLMRKVDADGMLQSLLHSKASVEVVGYYGDNQVMQKLLRQKVGIHNELLHRGTLDPGLYACLQHPVVHIFLWLPPSEDQWKEASQKDPACNFVRYIMDLCSTVYVCIPELVLLPPSEVASTSQSRRNQEMQFSCVKGFEDDITISPGFSLHLMLNDSCSTTHNNFLLSEGSSRCALLFSRKCMEILPPVRRVENTTVADLPTMLEQWKSSSYDLDFTRLPDEDFLVLLKYVDPGSSQKYEEMHKFCQNSIKQHCKTARYSPTAKRPSDGIAALESLFRQTLGDCQELMQQRWNDYRLAATVQGSSDLGHQTFLDSLQHGWSEIWNTNPESERCIIQKFWPADCLSNFSMLEEQFLMQWTRQGSVNGQLGLVFEGDRVQIVKAGTMQEVLFPECQDYGFIIVNSSSGMCKKAPLKLRQWIRLIHMDKTLNNVTFTALPGCFSYGVLLAGVTLQMTVGSRTIPVKLIRLQGDGSVPGLLLWIDCLCQKQFGEIKRHNSRKFSDACKNYYLSLPNYILRDNLIPMLEQKLEFENRIEREKLEAEQKRRTEELLATLKQTMGKKTGQESTLSILQIEVKRKPKAMIWPQLHSAVEEEDELVLTEQFDYAPRDFLVWKAVELQHSSDDEQQKLFIPKASPESQFVQANSGKEKLLKCVLLKSSDVLFFLQDIESGSVTIRRHPHFCCAPYADANPIAIIRQGCDIMAFDESSRTIVFYDKSIKLYCFDEAFQHCDWTGVEISLTRFCGSACIRWMELIPGKLEIVLIDDSWRVRVFEIAPAAMMKPKQIQLPGPFVRAVISTDGSCLICLYPESGDTISPVGSSETQVVVGASGSRKLLLRVYLLRDSLCHLKDVPVNLSVSDMAKVGARVVLFGSQMHLVIHASDNAKEIVSLVLRISLMEEYIKMEVRKNNCSSTAGSDELMESRREPSCPHLDYIFHIYDKFPTCPPLVDQRPSLELTLLLAQTLFQRTTVGYTATPSVCKDYVQDLLRKLAEKGKSFENLEIIVSSYYFDEFLNSPIQVSRNNATALIGTWISKFLSLVPVQIACAEDNSLRPLINGLEINSAIRYGEAVAMSNVIQFGFYDVILNSWNGKVTVISTMGQANSGKLYLLNHLTGSLFDIAGSTCAYGVWMTTRIASDCLYVLLDVEGLGSFEGSDQEDMLLSLLSAAMSNVTLFNTRDLHLDRETELLFDRFQGGVNLLKQDAKLFQGLFYIAIKDVEAVDIQDLQSEFQGKIRKICSKTNDNFLLKMYNGRVEITAMAPSHSLEYQESVREIADTIQSVESSYNSGRSFMRDMKLLIAQICTKDWSPLDANRVALRLQFLRQHLTSAVRMGCLSTESKKKALISLDSEEEVEDSLLQVDNVAFELPDGGLELFPFQPSTMLGSILEKLKCEFEKIEPWTGEKDEVWFALFEKFLLALVERRKKRIFLWLERNNIDLSEDGDVQKLKLEANAALAELKEGLTPCSAKCTFCFLKCILEKGHLYDHSCMGSHVCTNFCSFCLEEDRDAAPKQCTDVSGHCGPHNCKNKSHTCGRTCNLAASSSNCNNSCALKVGHPGPHRCNSLLHTCKMVCGAPVCKNMCIFPLELGDHEKHACYRTFCLSKCLMPLCTRPCATKDHFHASNPKAKHFCENEHLCQSQCEAEGRCVVQTEGMSSFEYGYSSEQNGLRKSCCIVIPALCDKHDGMHVHTLNPDDVHLCDKKCPSCGHFCNLLFGHDGLHRTVHGNMMLTRFASESEYIQIMDRRYEWGESGEAEMCMMHCKSQGRGHIHLIPCPEGEGGVCTGEVYNGARHETRKYGPDVDTPKDEMTHETYWKYVGFEDPYTEEEQELFALCGHYCRSEEHQSETAGMMTRNVSYCTEKLWHAPITREGEPSFAAGFVSDDGHCFNCYHEMYMPVSIIFVVHKFDFTSSYESILRFIRTRLATVTDDSLAVVLCDTIAVPPQVMSGSDIVGQVLKARADLYLPHVPSRIEYGSWLLKTEDVLCELEMNPLTQAKKPIVIFMGGGEVSGDANDLVLRIRRMKQKHPDLILHTIECDNIMTKYHDILREMAESGEGRCHPRLDDVQLPRVFEGIARSLRPKIAALIHRQILHGHMGTGTGTG